MGQHAEETLVLPSPVGPIALRSREGCLLSLGFTPDQPLETEPKGFLAEVATQILAYFADPGFRFEIPLFPRGTPFQNKVWQGLRDIPAGRVLTYGQLARLLETGPRAVGLGCRTNPWPLIVPCHRVISAQGPGGYMGKANEGFLAIKRRLLAHEGIPV